MRITKPAVVFINLLCLLIVTKGLGQQKLIAGHDTSYYISYEQDIVARIYLSQKYTDLELKKGNDAPRLRYKPNTNLNLGIGASYHNLTLNLAYGFGFLNHDQEKGKTKKLDLQSRVYTRKWSVNLYGQFYKEFYEYPKGRGNADNSSYYMRPDLNINILGASVYRVINYRRFTLHPAFVQDEVQKKSAGSIVAGAMLYYGNIKGDSALVPSQLALFYDRRSISKVRILEFGPGVGYAYTQVLPYNFFLTGFYTFNVNLGLVKETGISGSTDHISANANMIYRVGAGYNNGDWNISAFWANARFSARGSLSGNDYLTNTGNYRLNFTKRIQPGPKVRKRLRLIERALPIN
jgi:hypothetical protein